MAHPSRYVAFLAGAVVLSLPGAGPATASAPRNLSPAASAMIQAAGARLGGDWNLQELQVSRREVRVAFCADAQGDRCFRLRLCDPRPSCAGDVAGPWCVRFEGDARPPGILEALASEPGDPWEEDRSAEVPAPQEGRVSEAPTRPATPSVGPDAAPFAAALALALASLLLVLAWILRSILRRKFVSAIVLALLGLPAVGVLAEGGVRATRWLFPPPPPDTFPIYAVGGSSMQGAPYPPRYAPPAFLASVFDGWIGDRPIEIRNLARHGWSIGSESVLLERAVADRDPHAPGVLLVYSGHNEGYVHPGSPEPPGLLDRMEPHFAAIREWRRAFPPPLGPAGRFSRTEACLRRVIETGLGAGLVPLLATAPSNHSGVEPTVPLDLDLDAARQALAAGRALEDEGRLEEAAEAYLQADPSGRIGALLAFRAARCLHRAGQADRAAALYDRAIDEDPRTRFGRATTAQNEVIRRLAAEYHVPLVDADARFRAASADGIPGDDLFVDGHHPNLRGYRLLAEAFAEAVTRRFQQPPIRTFDPGTDPCADLGCSPQVQSAAHVAAANWRLAAAVRHPDPRDLLAGARRHLDRAIELVPDDPGSRIARAVLDGAQRGGMLWTDDDVQRLQRWHFGFSGHPCVPAGEREPMRARLRELGVDPALLEGFDRADRDGRAACEEDGSDRP